MNDEEITVLECPRCGESVQECDYEMLHFDCPSCGLNFDMAVCESCGSDIGSFWGDNDICPKCGEVHTFDTVKVSEKAEAEAPESNEPKWSNLSEALRRWNEGRGIRGYK